MKNFKNLIWGLILILFGIILALKSLGLLSINIFFKGWWTLFIIVPSFISLFTEKDKTGSVILVIIGLALLVGVNDIVSFDLIWKLLLPIIIIVFGLSLIFKEEVTKALTKTVKKINDSEEIYATFSSQDIKIDNEEFRGLDLNAIFGGIKLDLRKAKIEDDVVINTCSIFGGIDILIPDGVKIKVKSNSLFGGVTNNKNGKNNDKSKIIYINSVCLFGGVEIK